MAYVVGGVSIIATVFTSWISEVGWVGVGVWLSSISVSKSTYCYYYYCVLLRLVLTIVTYQNTLNTTKI